MIKKIIATLILVTLPLLSQADIGIYEEISIGANADMSANSSSTTEIESDGFFCRMINWFKG